MSPSEAVFAAPAPHDLLLTVGAQQFGPKDPTLRLEPGGARKAAWTPEGPVALHLLASPGQVRARAWGPGAAWAMERLPGYLGLEDRPEPLAEPLRGRLPGLRLQRVPWLHEVLYKVILCQRVQIEDAQRSHLLLVKSHGEDAPGPLGLRLAPPPEQLARLGSHAFFLAGVDGRRAAAVRAGLLSPGRLQALHAVPREEARRRLASLPGVGPWTVEFTMGMGLGDPDAVPTGDYGLPRDVAWALAGELRADDARMLELLEPFRGNRYRAVRTILLTSGAAPRRGPRLEFPGPPRRR